MHTLHRLRALACWLLAWFALSIAAATASPLVAPQSVQLICAGAGEVRLLMLTDDGTQEQRGPLLDCPLCVHLGGAAPPAAWDLPPVLQPPLAHSLPPARATRCVARTAAPLPARGPPHTV